MIAGLIIGGLIGYFIGYIQALGHDICPREIRGYSCRGDTCNHSKYEIERAVYDMRMSNED